MKRFLTSISIALAAAGCASTYQLTLMPRDSGKLFYGVAEETGGAEGRISVTIGERTYTGTWVEVASDRSTAYVTGFGGRRGALGLGGMIMLDNNAGSATKALLRSTDGAGLRCEFRGGSGLAGGGLCREDSGLEYDVQIRLARQKTPGAQP